MLDSLFILAQRGAPGGEVFVLCFGCFMISMFALSIAGAAFQIWMLIDCCIYESKMPDNQLVLWILLIVFLSFIGAAVYYFVRRPNNRVGMSMYNKPQGPPHDPYWRPPY
jgi:prolipoprotein diacylglyceryltransferase